jgi:ATP-dependent Clp protease ATP-binding subunit ClpA
VTGPFDRFNDRAKRVLALAQDEAVRFGHNYIGPEHLLLGLVREGEGVAARALDALGVDLSKLRTYVEANVGRGSEERPSEITLSPQLKKIIELAVDEARVLGHSHVGTEHLTLGIVRHGEGVAADALGSLGVTLEKLRHQIIATIGTVRPRQAPTQRLFQTPVPAGDPVLALAAREAISLGHDWVGSEHVLLGLLRTESTAEVLGGLGVGYDAARTAVIGTSPQRSITPTNVTLTPRVHALVGFAKGYARARGVAPDPRWLLLALSEETDSIGSQILTSLGATADKVRSAIEGRPPAA